MLIQYGVIPVRRNPDGGLEVLLITSRETKRWVVPRGNPIPGLSPVRSAAQEAYEEAGVVGDVRPEPLGRYRYDKRRRDGSLVPAEVEMYLMEVESLAEAWPERRMRERRWFGPEEAAEAVAEGELAGILRRLE